MALLFCDGFDNYGSYVNMEKNNWFNVGHNATFPAGRFHGKSLSTTVAILSIGSSLSYGVFGVAVKNLNVSPGEINFNFMNITGGTTFMIAVRLTMSTGVITVYEQNDWAGNLTKMAESQPSRFSSTAWFYLEIKCDSSTGVEVKIDGATALTHTHVLTGTNSGGVFNAVSISSSVLYGLDDLYMCDATSGEGIHPMNDFLGDKRILTLFPTSNDSVQFTPVVAVDYISPLLPPVGTFTAYANMTYLSQWDEISAFSAKQDSVLSLIRIYSTTNVPTAHVRPVVYTEDPANLNKPKDLYAIGDETLGVFIGANPIQFGSVTVNLTKGTKYWLGFISDTELSLDQNQYAGGGATWVASTYPDAPLEYNWSVPTGGRPWPMIIDYSITATNYGMVSEDDADIISYNRSDTLGDKDLFALTSSLTSNSVVWAVQVNGLFMKDDSGPRSVANVIKSGTTEALSVDHPLNADFRFVKDVWVRNPATTAEWVHSEIGTMKIGYKVTV